jgi:hypothetical protein
VVCPGGPVVPFLGGSFSSSPKDFIGQSCPSWIPRWLQKEWLRAKTGTKWRQACQAFLLLLATLGHLMAQVKRQCFKQKQFLSFCYRYIDRKSRSLKPCRGSVYLNQLKNPFQRNPFLNPFQCVLSCNCTLALKWDQFHSNRWLLQCTSG